MKKSNLVKIVLVLCVSLMVMLFSTSVMAAEEIDLTETLNNMSNNTNTNNSNQYYIFSAFELSEQYMV